MASFLRINSIGAIPKREIICFNVSTDIGSSKYLITLKSLPERFKTLKPSLDLPHLGLCNIVIIIFLLLKLVRMCFF